MTFKDRIPAKPNRYAITDENGNVEYVVIKRADEPVEPGTPLNADTFNRMLNMVVMPIGYIFEWSPVEGGPDLSTAEKVAAHYGFGTWEAFGSGRFTLGASKEYAVGSVGGESKHTLTVEEMPSHKHSPNHSEYNNLFEVHWSNNLDTSAGDTKAVYLDYYSTGDTGAVISTSEAGGNQPHNNMPPYEVVYRWRRIA